jgi:hypothetical protein
MLRLLQNPDGTYAIYFGEEALATGLSHRQAAYFAIRANIKPQH